jgi:hypothetical protein
MTLFIVAKLAHITSAIFFIGCVYFRTLIVPRIRPVVGEEVLQRVEMALVKPSRAFGRVNNAILLLSGSYLFYTYFDASNSLLHVKAMLGFLVIAFFYTAPFFVFRLPLALRLKVHHTLLALMLVIIVCSQLMFY